MDRDSAELIAKARGEGLHEVAEAVRALALAMRGEPAEPRFSEIPYTDVEALYK